MVTILKEYYGFKNEENLHGCNSHALQIPADQQNAAVTESASNWKKNQ